MKAKVGGIEVETVVGDITKLSVEVIANSASYDLRMESGVAGAIKLAGGEEIEREAITQGPLKAGEAVITSGGKLGARYVIHCASRPPGSSATYSKVRASVLSGLRLASSKSIRSVAFPAIGTENGGMSNEESANAIIAAIREHSRHPGAVQRIVLVASDTSMAQNFEDVLKKLERWTA